MNAPGDFIISRRYIHQTDHITGKHCHLAAQEVELPGGQDLQQQTSEQQQQQRLTVTGAEGELWGSFLRLDELLGNGITHAGQQP